MKRRIVAVEQYRDQKSSTKNYSSTKCLNLRSKSRGDKRYESQKRKFPIETQNAMDFRHLSPLQSFVQSIFHIISRYNDAKVEYLHLRTVVYTHARLADGKQR